MGGRDASSPKPDPDSRGPHTGSGHQGSPSHASAGQPQTPLRVAPPPPRSYSCCPQAEWGAHGGTGLPGGGSEERELLPVFSCWAERKWPWGPGEGSLRGSTWMWGRGLGSHGLWSGVRSRAAVGRHLPPGAPETPLFPLEQIRGVRGSLLQAPDRRGPCPGWGKPQHLTGEAPLVRGLATSTGSGLCRGSGHRRRDSPALDSGQTQGTWREFRAFGGIGQGKAWSYTSRTWPWAVGAAQPGQGDPRLVAAQPAHHAGSFHIPWARG